MVKVITYGSFDLLHYGHIKLLERAKALGDYLIVGITSDDYDRTRGKINLQQTLMERIRAVESTNLADEIIVEEYEGQKIEDIRKYGVDIFTVGSDWEGYFDYLNEYCKVIYLPRTEGVSSSTIRTEKRKFKLGIIGDAFFKNKFIYESNFVNGVEVVDNYELNIDDVDAVYIISEPQNHYNDVKQVLLSGKHVLCMPPVALTKEECNELFQLAKDRDLILMDGTKTAYSTAYERMVLIAKSGRIGQVLSVDSVCTSLSDNLLVEGIDLNKKWNSICGWAPTALLPVFQILGTEYINKNITTKFLDKDKRVDAFTKIDFVFKNAVASIKVAKLAKSEGELIVTGTKGYIFVPAPWWKTDYFEIRYENQEDNRRFFFQLDGEGIRNEILAFSKAVDSKTSVRYISENITQCISSIIGDFNNLIDLKEI